MQRKRKALWDDPRVGMPAGPADPSAQAGQARAFAEEHVVALARELVAWRRTGMRPTGRLDDLAAVLQPLHGDDSVRMAADYATNAALNRVARD